MAANRRGILTLLASAGPASLLLGEPGTATPQCGNAKKPNILFMLVDNLGYGELAAMLVAPRAVRQRRGSIN